MSEKFEASKTSGAHYQLSRLVGDWEGTARTWFEPDKIADESPVSGTMRLILGGRFIMHEYQGSFGEKPVEGIAIYGYHLGLQRFQSAWLDSFHNGSAIMFSEGERGDNRLKLLGELCLYRTRGRTAVGMANTYRVHQRPGSCYHRLQYFAGRRGSKGNRDRVQKTGSLSRFCNPRQ